MNKKQKKIFIRIIIAFILIIILPFMHLSQIPTLILYITAYLIIGYDVLKKALNGIVNFRPLDENFLMTVASIGAFALAIFTESGEYTEAVAVMLFYQIGELFQSYAVNKSRKNISELMDIRPDYANTEINGKIIKVKPDEVNIGDIIIVNPGEKIPIDGIIEKGNSTLNTLAVTGESIPKSVSPGDEVLSGYININGVLYIKTVKEFGESTVSKILELVESSNLKKSKSESFIAKFAKIYTPLVCCAAIVLGVFLPLIRLLVGLNANWLEWLYRALTFLVVSCPCALVVSVPLTFFAGIGCAGHEGILIKGSEYLEALSKTDTVIFDKTGTLTKGVFSVTEICGKIENEKLLEYAALAECASTHPISKSIQEAYGKPIEHSRVKNINEISGYGITAVIDNNEVAVGNSKLMDKLNIKFIPCNSIGTVIHIAVNCEYCGYIIISDIVKPTSGKAILMLKRLGITNTVMLTGDNNAVAKSIAKQLNISEVYGELLPGEKVTAVEKLISNNKKTAFAGDGINDAPVLTRADVGIAMGGIGSDAAIEAADVVLMNDDPIQIAKAIKISRKCISIVKQNIIFSLAVKFACLILAAFGFANMWLAVFADVGVMMLAVLNAIRALRIKF